MVTGTESRKENLICVPIEMASVASVWRADVDDETVAIEEEEGLAGRVISVRDRSLVFLPVSGNDAPVVEAQARTTQMDEESLTELISSIATHGVLQPIVVEKVGSKTRLVAGERRLRAFQYLAEHHPDNPHVLAGIPALVAENRYADDERRSAQIAENLVRADLTVSELGEALLWVRCAVLMDKLDSLGHDVPDEVRREDSAVERWAMLETFRIETGAHNVGAPWAEVLQTVGIQVPAQRAQLLARAVSELPPGIGEEMDELNVSLHSRIKWLGLAEQDPETAAKLWEEVRDREKPEVLSSAVAAAKANPGMDPSDVVEAVSSLKDRGDRQASEDWMTSRAAAEAAALAAEAEGDDGDSGGLDGEPFDDTRAPSAAKVIGTLRKLLKELESGLTVTPREREQVKTLCAQALVSLDEGDDGDAGWGDFVENNL
jgi:ParB/RepB/Spo0J family partition protein